MTVEYDEGSPLDMALRGVHYEVSPREREDEQRRDRWDEGVDPWGYDEPTGDIEEFESDES